MSLTKDDVAQALGQVLPAGVLERSSVCEGYVSLRVSMDAGTPRERLDGIARGALGALSARAALAGGRVDSLIVEFVDRMGTVFHTSRPTGAGAPGAVHGTGRDAGAGAAVGGAGGGGGGGGHQPLMGAGVAPSTRAPTPQAQASALPGVRHVIAVGAGKGGVGKSTIALNVAVGLARRGHAVGLMDGDIYGPSLPTLLGLDALEAMVLRGKLQPFLVHGVKAMTIGKLVDAEKPLIWRGPMAHGAFKQLADQTEWGELDYLVIDLPPGTGDVPLTMAQMLRLTGAVVVCTPQKVAQDDAVRAARMFQQLGIDVLGVVENMSTFIADDLDPPREYDIFGKGGAQVMAQRLGVPFLGAVPLTISLRKNSDAGDPTGNFEKGTALARSLEELVTNVENQVALAAMKQGQTRPTLTIS